ncbi:MAG: GIY-YIG nuclease family protein [Acidobacteria bacterium]|nr:GIY-YIG nuclease family protein [Acidobacteriota bacterium]
MASVYILQSHSSGRYYVGSTNDLSRRLSEHDRAHSQATRGRGPWRLVHQESFPTLSEARWREHEIKGWKSSKLITKLIADSVG